VLVVSTFYNNYIYHQNNQPPLNFLTKAEAKTTTYNLRIVLMNMRNSFVYR